MTTTRRAQHVHDITTLYVTAERLPAPRPATVITTRPADTQPVPRVRARAAALPAAESLGPLYRVIAVFIAAPAVALGGGLWFSTTAVGQSLPRTAFWLLVVLVVTSATGTVARHCPGCRG